VLLVASWAALARVIVAHGLSTGYFYIPEKRGTAVPFTNLTGFGKMPSGETTYMKITEAGKRTVGSPEFALTIREFLALAQRHAAGMSEEMGKATTLSVIAWAVAGHDINTPPKDSESVELALFINEHAAEQNAFADKCLENLVHNDCGDTVN
jgi:hypothetical protein